MRRCTRLTIGAIGTMLLAVMSRAALGHTGRPLKAHAPTVGAYVLISVAAVLRVAAALMPLAYLDLLIASGIAWAVGFALFLLVYAPILLLPRPREVWLSTGGNLLVSES